MNEMLARLVNLQQFVQGGHGSNSRAYQGSGDSPAHNGYGGNPNGETSLYEEMRLLKKT